MALWASVRKDRREPRWDHRRCRGVLSASKTAASGQSADVHGGGGSSLEAVAVGARDEQGRCGSPFAPALWAGLLAALWLMALLHGIDD